MAGDYSGGVVWSMQCIASCHQYERRCQCPHAPSPPGRRYDRGGIMVYTFHVNLLVCCDCLTFRDRITPQRTLEQVLVFGTKRRTATGTTDRSAPWSEPVRSAIGCAGDAKRLT